MARKTSAVAPKAPRIQDERMAKYREQERARARHANRRSTGRQTAQSA